MPNVCEVKSGSMRYFEFTEEFEGRPASDFLEDEEDSGVAI